MAQGRQAVEDAGLVRLSASIERWRQTRTKLSPMPAALCDKAAAVAARLGIPTVAQAVGLNASRLRAQVGGQQLDVPP